jgi:hypothetical protein
MDVYCSERGLVMTVVADAVMVVAAHEYLDAPSATATVPAWVTAAYSRTGWERTSAYAAEIAVEFVDGRGGAANGGDLPQIEGLPMTGDLPVAATISIPVTVLRFSRGPATGTVEIADISTPLGRIWAAHVTQPGAMRPLGTGGLVYADDKGAVLLVGDLLIRADMWEDGVVGRTARTRTGAMTREIVDALDPAHSA